MRLRMLKSKIHRAVVTHADVNYEGSVTIDERLLQLSDIKPYEWVHIWDVTNGARLETYALPGEEGSGVISINGAAARLVTPGDLVIIASQCELDESEADSHEPKLVFVNSKNEPMPTRKEIAGPRLA